MKPARWVATSLALLATGGATILFVTRSNEADRAIVADATFPLVETAATNTPAESGPAATSTTVGSDVDTTEPVVSDTDVLRPAAGSWLFINTSGRTLGTIPLRGTTACKAPATSPEPAYLVGEDRTAKVTWSCVPNSASVRVALTNDPPRGRVYSGKLRLGDGEASVVELKVRRTTPLVTFVVGLIVAGLLGLLVQVWVGSRRRLALVHDALDGVRARMARNADRFLAEHPTPAYDALPGWIHEADEIEMEHAALGRYAFTLDKRDGAVVKRASDLRDTVRRWPALAPVVSSADAALATHARDIPAFSDAVRAGDLPLATSPTAEQSQRIAARAPLVLAVLDRYAARRARFDALATQLAAVPRPTNPALHDAARVELESIRAAFGSALSLEELDVAFTGMVRAEAMVRTLSAIREPDAGVREREAPPSTPTPRPPVDTARGPWARYRTGVVDSAVVLAAIFVALVAAYQTLYAGQAFGRLSQWVGVLAWGIGGGLAGTAIRDALTRASERDLEDLRPLR